MITKHLERFLTDPNFKALITKKDTNELDFSFLQELLPPTLLQIAEIIARLRYSQYQNAQLPDHLRELFLKCLATMTTVDTFPSEETFQLLEELVSNNNLQSINIVLRTYNLIITSNKYWHLIKEKIYQFLTALVQAHQHQSFQFLQTVLLALQHCSNEENAKFLAMVDFSLLENHWLNTRTSARNYVICLIIILNLLRDSKNKQKSLLLINRPNFLSFSSLSEEAYERSDVSEAKLFWIEIWSEIVVREDIADETRNELMIKMCRRMWEPYIYDKNNKAVDFFIMAVDSEKAYLREIGWQLVIWQLTQGKRSFADCMANLLEIPGSIFRLLNGGGIQLLHFGLNHSVASKNIVLAFLHDAEKGYIGDAVRITEGVAILIKKNGDKHQELFGFIEKILQMSIENPVWKRDAASDPNIHLRVQIDCLYILNSRENPNKADYQKQFVSAIGSLIKYFNTQVKGSFPPCITMDWIISMQSDICALCDAEMKIALVKSLLPHLNGVLNTSQEEMEWEIDFVVTIAKSLHGNKSAIQQLWQVFEDSSIHRYSYLEQPRLLNKWAKYVDDANFLKLVERFTKYFEQFDRFDRDAAKIYLMFSAPQFLLRFPANSCNKIKNVALQFLQTASNNNIQAVAICDLMDTGFERRKIYKVARILMPLSSGILRSNKPVDSRKFTLMKLVAREAIPPQFSVQEKENIIGEAIQHIKTTLKMK